jgi:acyl-CoA thioesterase-1
MRCRNSLPVLFRWLIVIAAGSSFWNCGSAPKKMDRVEESGPTAPKEPPASKSADTRPSIVALGDSLTAGLGVDPARNYPSVLQGKLDAAGYLYRVVNAGVSGDTSAQGLNRLAGVRSYHPVVVILSLGANDGLRGIPVSATSSNLDRIITQLKQDGSKVILLGMQMPPNYGAEYTQAFSAVYPDLARKHEMPLVPFMLAGVAGDSRFNQEDGIHPTAEGYEIVAENVWKVLKPLLDKSRPR